VTRHRDRPESPLSADVVDGRGPRGEHFDDRSELASALAAAKAQAASAEILERKLERLKVAQQERLGQAAQATERLQTDLERSRAECADLTVRVASAEAQLARAGAALADAQVRLAGLAAELQMVARSRSWRVTAPFRALRRAFSRRACAPGRVADAARTDRGGPQAADASTDEPRAGRIERSFAAPPPSETQADTSEKCARTAADAVGSYASRKTADPPQTGEPMSRCMPDADRWSDYVPLRPQAPVTTSVKLIAFYLPQFHPIRENDRWWGRGFTEWTNVTRAEPQFRGHYQPHLPGELGFYDLRVPDVQRRQIELARMHGVFGFCYYHYWFGGRKLLHRPLDQLLSDPSLDLPFCLCWANENWTRTWDGGEDEVLIEQRHSAEDDLAFLRDIEPALRDARYIRVGNRPLLVVYRPALLPDAGATAERWRVYCREVGVGDPFLVAAQAFDRQHPGEYGFDAALEFPPNNMDISPAPAMPDMNPGFAGTLYDYRDLVRASRDRADDGFTLFRGIIPMWDNEARRPSRGVIFTHATPAAYREWLEYVCRWTVQRHTTDRTFVFVNAWNEWAEGAHLEPDRRYGYAYLQATADALRGFEPRQTDTGGETERRDSAGVV
jgi:hypothetical protein